MIDLATITHWFNDADETEEELQPPEFSSYEEAYEWMKQNTIEPWFVCAAAAESLWTKQLQRELEYLAEGIER